MFQRRHKKLTYVLLGVSLVAALWVLSEQLMFQDERRFIGHLESRLHKAGDWTYVVDVEAGDWTEVCLFPPFSSGSELWVAQFNYAPDKVVTYNLPVVPIYGEGAQFSPSKKPYCRNRGEAVFLVTDTRFDITYKAEDFRLGGKPTPIPKRTKVKFGIRLLSEDELSDHQ